MFLMEFPTTTNMSLLVLVFIVTITMNPVFAANGCDVIFNYGDSNSDTGGLAAAFIRPPPPYGQTFFNMPAGRFSDGRLILDFMATYFKLPFIHPYLDSLSANFSYGANFATAASTIEIPTSVIPSGRNSPFSLAVQFFQFANFIPRSQVVKTQGGCFASLVPELADFSKALYTFDIGQNDIRSAIFSNMTLQQINATIPRIVNTLAQGVKNVSKLGARTIWIHNTGPIGCIPYINGNFKNVERDEYGCAKPYNEICQYFNLKLKEAVFQLRKELPLTKIIYVDIYSVKRSLFTNPAKYGFEKPLVACCGYGGEYNYSDEAQCGQYANVNGTRVFVGSCPRPSVRVSWDGTHYTEAANKFVFDQISSGNFSDPPTPLNMACALSSTSF